MNDASKTAQCLFPKFIKRFLSVNLHLLRSIFGRALAPFDFRPLHAKVGSAVFSMAHKRGRRNSKSKESRTQWDDARQFDNQQAFFDRRRGESVWKITTDDIACHLAEEFGQPVPEAVPNVERGLVLRNKRGDGAFPAPVRC